MDLVSFETRAEYEWVKERLGGVQFIWTSGSSVIRGHRVHSTRGVKKRLGGVQLIWTSGSSVIRGH